MSTIAKRKISTGPDLQPIFENEDVVQRFEYNVIIEPFPILKQVPSPKAGAGCNRPPQPHAPVKKMAANEQIDFVSDTFAWLQKELEVFKQQEKKDDNTGGNKDIMHFYKNLMTTVNNLKRVTTTFQEQADQCASKNGEVSSSSSAEPFIVDLNTKKTLLARHTTEKGLCECKEKQLPCS